MGGLASGATRVAENNASSRVVLRCIVGVCFRTAERFHPIKRRVSFTADDETKRSMRAMGCDVDETRTERHGASDGCRFEQG
jgi:hypothetical protein